MSAQVLDTNPIERERGITIKLAPVRMEYRKTDGETVRQSDNTTSQSEAVSSSDVFILNLIDTPGHVDFSYEVSRSLAACEGAILVVDATQGIQAQTLANFYQAKKHNLSIIPVINKIDLANARVEESLKELQSLGFVEDEVIPISAKTGENVAAVLEAIVARVPPPAGEWDKPLRALVFSSQYDAHKGVVVFVRVVDGCIAGGPPRGAQGAPLLRFMASGATVTPIEIGYFTPNMTKGDAIHTGEVGYIATGLKDIRYAKIGDTIARHVIPAKAGISAKSPINSTQIPDQVGDDGLTPLPGYQEPKSMVFLGLFPVATDEFQQAREAMEKLRLSDSAFTFRPISSLALGNGFHCGFLGLLHAEVVQERLLREFGLTMLATAPSVEYRIRLRGEKTIRWQDNEKVSQRSEYQRLNVSHPYITIQSAAEFPDPSLIEEVKEPVMQVFIFSPKRYVGHIMQLCQEKRAEYIDLSYIGEQAKFTYLVPLSEMIIDFFDRLKSATEGYASLDYEFFDYQRVDVVKLDILFNREKVDAFSSLVVKDQAQEKGKYFVEKLAQIIPRQQFEVPIQAAIGGKVIARADVKAFRKDVTAKLYGGDRSRKDKLLDKQKKGKAKMKMIGRVEIPQSAFFAVLRRE